MSERRKKRYKYQMAQRARDYDRVAFTIDKGGSNLIKALAKREGVSLAELIRRAILARAGLRLLPYPDAPEELKDITDSEAARDAIKRLQVAEMGSNIVNHLLSELSAEPPTEKYTVAPTDADRAELLLTLKHIEEAAQAGGDIKITGLDVSTMRRFLSNIQR